MSAREQAIERLDQLVSIETPTGDVAGLAAAQQLVRSWLDPVLGAQGVLETVDGVSHLLWAGGETPSVLLLGHLDTVFPKGTIDERPFRLDGDRATGPGVFDMKAGIVIMAAALARVARPGEVAVLLTSDEEVGSLTSRTLIEREAARAGTVLVLEPSLDGALKIARRGGSIYRLELTGRAAHAGLEPWKGRSALTELAHHVLALPALADDERGTTVSPTVARAGTVTNVIPEHAEVRIDVRAWTLDELERVDAEMQVLEAHTEGVSVEVIGGINRPPMEASSSAELLTCARLVSERLGHPEVEAVSAGGASDGNFTAAVGARTLDGLGPRGAGAHADHEWVSVESMVERIDLLAGMLDELAR
ncbi:M20 family metallopeptidase [Microbacterium saperdae]|uniref:Glutamate carboxypeptidase n=1 Tax=Microbacterium saperdae TaxID=69368 RepID=A0A543BBC3_9MICO|nr:M20 family metallopeptidase [Microbacterium saperdae]TQL82066.1 glutamate carboxypeptidase [Microbacterium saperdae]GGM36926.1 peptidase M20 [Microbacterium saperdae]